MALLKTDIQKIIKKELGEFLKKYGYKYDAKAEGFLRYFDGGFNKVGIAIFDYRPKFKISPFFLIRIDEVEKIVQKLVFVMEKYRDAAYTINTGIEYFTGVKEYEIFTEEQLYHLLESFKEVYTTKVDVFLRECSDIKNLDQVINDQEKVINNLIEPDNRIRSIIIAGINKNPHFQKIADKYYQNYVEEYNLDPGGANRIRETIDYLKSL
jgi:hypothetical protein